MFYKTENSVQKKGIIGFTLFLETSAKTRDGVQCAFEEVVIKILQTPGLWDTDKQKCGVQLETAAHTEEDFCGGYCTLT